MYVNNKLTAFTSDSVWQQFVEDEPAGRKQWFPVRIYLCVVEGLLIFGGRRGRIRCDAENRRVETEQSEWLT